MTTSLFISKEVSGLVSTFCSQKQIELIAFSFLQFHLIPNKFSGDYDVLFFASPRAVDFYLQNHTIPSNKMIAAAGEGTANHLIKMGFNVDFIPKQSGRVELSAKEFANWVGDRHVLFPISNISNQSYTHYLASNQIATVVVYETTQTEIPVKPCDVYVFTSPSNVRSFLKSNDITANSTIISWGESTTKELLLNGVNQSITTLNESSEACLIKVLEKFL